MPLRPNSFVPSREDLARLAADWSPADVVFFLRQCLERGGYDHALALGEALAPKLAADPTVKLTLAVARFVGGERERAFAEVEALVATRTTDTNARYVLSEMRARAGNRPGAVALLTELVESYPDYPGAQALLSSLRMPGPPYREVLKAVHQALAPRTYLEIGVETGGTLTLAGAAAVAVGVDPGDFALEHPLPKTARIVRKTSDAFFQEHTRESVFGARAVELAFIDGMHLWENALRDFANVESWCSESSTIILHDCVPLADVAQERERRTRFWVGDTWKAVWALARHRPELRIRAVLTPPSGLVVIRRLDPSSRVLFDAFSSIEQELAALRYPFSVTDFPAELHAVPNDASGLAEALG